MGALGCWQELLRYSTAKKDELRSASSAFAAATAQPVAAGDRSGALQALRGIAGIPTYQYASVRNLNNIIIAEVGSGARLADDLSIVDGKDNISPIGLFLTGTVSVDEPIRQNGEIVGRLQLVSDTREVRSRLLVVALSALAGAGIALVVGLAISLRMQKALTDPLLRLTTVIAGIEGSHSYDHAVEIDSDDEIGLLAQAFRDLLGSVRERDVRLIQHQSRLETDVADRTRELVAAKFEADQANAAKSDFLATMSHEIRTPMNGMLVMAELLAKADLSPAQRRYAEVIAQSGQGLLAIINDILDFSKIEAGKLTLEDIAFDPGDVVGRVLNLHAAKAEEAGIDLAAFIAPDVPDILQGDPTRLGQIAGNIIGNAIKFTAKGSVTVRLEHEAGDLKLSVIDTGIGIPQDKLDSIFLPFLQAEQSTTRRYGGSGLGLSICKRLADAMGASIRVSSLPGTGTTFVVALHRTKRGDDLPSNPAPQDIFVDVAGPATRGCLIEWLAAAGHRVTDHPGNANHAVVDLDRLRGYASRPVSGRIVALVSQHAPELDVSLVCKPDLTLSKPLTRGDLLDLIDAIVGHRTIAGGTRRLDRAKAQQEDFSGLRVLVVDDSDLNLEVASAALEQVGIRAETCSNAADAIKRVLNGPYDLVLMDGSMPDMDGYTATRLIREHEARSGTRRTRIVALTAHVVGPLSEAWATCGMDGSLFKPFSVETLARVLRDIPADAREGGFREASASVLKSGERLSLLDAETIENLRAIGEQNGASFLSRLVELFGRDYPASLAGIGQACDREDAGALAAAAHKLKSMSLNIGALALAEKLQSIEVGARERQLMPSAAMLSDLTLTVAATMRELRFMLVKDPVPVTFSANSFQTAV